MSNPFAGAMSRFSHLAGFGRVNGKKAKAGDDKRHEEEEENEKDPESKRAEDDGDDERMESEKDDDEKAEGKDDDAGDDDGDEDSDKKKNKKGKKAADDKEECADDDEKDDKKEARGFRRGMRTATERAATILGSRHAAGRVQLAASLVANRKLSSAEAIQILKESPVARSDRSDRNPKIDVNGGGAPTGPQAINASWDRAMARFARK